MYLVREIGKLFSESYDSVAVMFAMIPNYIKYVFSERERLGNYSLNPMIVWQ